jgi:lysophospholipase L1-like esterase
MSEPTVKPLKTVEWFPKPPTKADGGIGSTLAKLAVGVVVGILLYFARHAIAAYVVWGIAGTVSAVSLASAGARSAIDRALAAFGRAVGSVVGAVLLTLVYFLVVTPTRALRRILGADDLHLRDAGRQSYWLSSDDDQRKVRWIGSMFVTEPPSGVGHPLLGALLGAVALVVLAEGVLRLKGFGHTVLYVADPDIGYYPQPSAELVRYGGRVATNKFGMRSPEIDRQKPPGVFRILMIGDSTLYGGSYIDQEDMYATQVSKRLNAAGAPGKVEVLAMGCNGWGPFHERGFIKKYPDAFQADLVLVQLPIDDVVRPLYGIAQVPFFPVQSPPRLGLEEVFNHFVWEYRERLSGKDDAWEARQAPTGIREYGLLTDDLERAGAEVMFFVLPTRDPGFGRGDKERPQYVQWRKELAATVAQRHVKLYHAEGFFVGKGTEAEIYRDDGIHLETKGHIVYAEFIEEKIRQDSTRFRGWESGHDGGHPQAPGTKPSLPHETPSNVQPAVEKP